MAAPIGWARHMGRRLRGREGCQRPPPFPSFAVTAAVPIGVRGRAEAGVGFCLAALSYFFGARARRGLEGAVVQELGVERIVRTVCHLFCSVDSQKLMCRCLKQTRA